MYRTKHTACLTVLGCALLAAGCSSDTLPTEHVGKAEQNLLNQKAHAKVDKCEKLTVELPSGEPGECLCTAQVAWCRTNSDTDQQTLQHPTTKTAKWEHVWSAGEGVQQFFGGYPEGDWSASREEGGTWASPDLALATHETIKVTLSCEPPPDAPPGSTCQGGIGAEFESNVHIVDQTEGGLTATRPEVGPYGALWHDDGGTMPGASIFQEGETTVTTASAAYHQLGEQLCGEVGIATYSTEGCSYPSSYRQQLKDAIGSATGDKGIGELADLALNAIPEPWGSILSKAEELASAFQENDCYQVSSDGPGSPITGSPAESTADLQESCKQVIPCNGEITSKVSVYTDTRFLTTGGMPPGIATHRVNKEWLATAGQRGLELIGLAMEPGCFVSSEPKTPSTPGGDQGMMLEPPPPATGCASDADCSDAAWPCCNEGACGECGLLEQSDPPAVIECKPPYPVAAEISGECCQLPAPSYGACCYVPGSPASQQPVLPEAGPCP